VFVAFTGTLQDGAPSILSNDFNAPSTSCRVSVDSLDAAPKIGDNPPSGPAASLSLNANASVPAFGRNAHRSSTLN
jgi:hypothetical protein